MPLTREEREQLIATYSDGPRRLRFALEAVPAEARQWRPAPGKWSVHEIVCHCADAEANAHGRLRYLLCEPQPTLAAFDQDAWTRLLDYHAHPLEPALATVDAVRANTVPLLRRLPEEAWSRTGTHTERGPYSVEDWLRSYAAHVEGHARQIERTHAAWKERRA